MTNAAEIISAHVSKDSSPDFKAKLSIIVGSANFSHAFRPMIRTGSPMSDMFEIFLLQTSDYRAQGN